MEFIRVFILGIIGEERTYIEDVLSNIEYIKIVGAVKSDEEAFEELETNFVDVILVDASVSGDGYRVAEVLSEEYPNMAIIMVEREFDEDIIYKSLSAGAQNVLFYPFTEAKLVETIYRAYELIKRRPVPTREKTSSLKPQKSLGKVLTVFSTKGGVGKTFVSVNLAVALQRETSKRVVLVDFDIDFGNVSLALNIAPRFTLTNVVEDIQNIDEDLMESYLLPHESGIVILPANAKPQMTEFINANHVEKILNTLRSSFDYIVVDMPARFYEPVNQALVSADMLLMITTPEISAIRNVKSALITLDELNYPQGKIKVILNKADNRGLIKEKDVEATLQQEVFGSISVDYKLATASLNQGVPVIEKGRPKGVAKEYLNLAKKITQEAPSSTENKKGRR
ncbi:pilus assembly protein CpaE [Alkalibaculum bacchi]|uniref:Stage 0 sporulation protein A homolog n=1 Tax=Alkalibaculum bacchi TaxID=645887 RepID=A0A366IBF3_9FIRM|nr:AAA family ATPase [Alkalibaculum bacchi]RBP65998.1 pilus assembly protein CpaE [Alkalibaculum bacchi]